MQQQLSQMTTQIPEDIARLAHEQQLGAPQANYAIMQLRRGWRWTQFVLPLGFLLFIMTFASLFISLSLGSFAFIDAIYLPTVVVSCALFIIGIIAWSFTHKFYTIYTCDRGFILRQSIAKFHIIRWDEIETIWQTTRIYPGFFSRGRLYTIHCHDGYTLTFSGFRKSLANLEKTLEEQFTRRHLPFQFADYQAGQTLRFGPLSVDHSGIAAQDRMLLWEQVANVTLVKDRHLVIQKIGEPPETWLKLPTFKIPNLSILLALFQRIRSGQTEQESGVQALADYGITTTVVPTSRKIDPLPEGLAALAEEHDLGERRLDQELGRSRLTSRAAIISLLVADAILFTYIVAFGTIFFTMFGEIRSFFLGPLMEIAIFSPFLILSATIGVIHRLQQIHNCTYTFERGIILKRGQQTPIVWRWEEIKEVWRVPPFTLNSNQRQQSTQPQNLYAYTIQLRNGARYTLTKYNIKQVTLGKLMKEQVVPLQLPAVADAYQAGQTLSFGPVQASQQGIAVGTRLLPWSQVKSVSLQGNQLAICDIARRKPWCKVLEKKVPNLFLLFALADYARDIAEKHE